MFGNIFGRSNESTRRKWIDDQLSNIAPGKRILDAGAGELRNRTASQHLRYTSHDFCQYDGRGDGTSLQTGEWDTKEIDIISDITDIPVEDQSFDVIVCTEVLEHLPDPILALKEFHRILSIDGQLILTAPFCSLTHFAPYHYATGLSRYWYETHLHDFGFSLIEATPNGGWHDYIAQELWRLPWIGKNYSNKILGWLGLILALPTLAILRLMKNHDRGSSELLTFGWQITARKT